MFKNYLITTFRNFQRNRFTSYLNIIGLGIGMAVFLIISQYVYWEKSYDQFHANKNQLFRVSHIFYKEGEVDYHGAGTFPKVGPALKADFPEVEEACRLIKKYRPGIVRYENQFFREENLYYADPSFFKLFSYPLLVGDPENVLIEPQTALIAKHHVKKYFGDENPIGKQIVVGSPDGEETFEIVGVFASPENSHLKFDFIFSYASLINLWGSSADNSWGWYDFYTYILLQPGTNIQAFEQKFPAFADKYGGERLGSNRVGFQLQKADEIYLSSNLIYEARVNGSASTVAFLLILSIFILVIALINYVNLATAKAINRAKEVGIRKTLGSSKLQLVGQFLLEALLVNGLALILGILLLHICFPIFLQLTGKSVEILLINQYGFWAWLLLLWIGGALLSGFYPALILSSYKPVAIVKGLTFRGSGKVRTRKILVIGQFVASAALIAGTLVVNNQLTFMKEHEMGIKVDSVLVIQAPNVITELTAYDQSLELYKNRLLGLPSVYNAAVSSEIPGKQVSWYAGSQRLGKDYEDFRTVIFRMSIDRNYLSMYDNHFLAGRNFQRAEDSLNIILNREAIDVFEYDSPQEAINQRLVIGRDTFSVIGVVENYHQESLKEAFRPTVFLYIPQELNFFTAKIDLKKKEEIISRVNQIYADVFPGTPFEYYFLDDYLSRIYEAENNFLKIFLTFAGLALLIALLGLIGLAFYAMEQRKKEITVRKVLGSTTVGIFILLSKDILKQILWANLIAAPIILYCSMKWLNNFAFRDAFPWQVLLVALFSTLLFALITVSFHIIKVASVNPALALRQE